MSNGAPPPVPGPVPTSTPPKKGMSPLAWVAIGCGGLMVVAFVGFLAVTAFVVKKTKDVVSEVTGSESLQDMVEGFKDNPVKTAAETMVRINPDLDLVESDDEAGTITFHNRKTGEEATVNFEDIAEGRFSVTTDEGDFSVDASQQADGGVTFKGPEGEARFGASADLSDVPDWVPAYPGATDIQSAMHSTTGDGMMGAVISKTSDEPQKVLDFYKEKFEELGYDIGSQSMTTTGQGAFGAITGEMSDGRSLNVGIIRQAGETQVTTNYILKKQ